MLTVAWLWSAGTAFTETKQWQQTQFGIRQEKTRKECLGIISTHAGYSFWGREEDVRICEQALAGEPEDVEPQLSQLELLIMVFTVVTQKTLKKTQNRADRMNKYENNILLEALLCIPTSTVFLFCKWNKKTTGKSCLPELAAGNTHNRSVLTHSSISREIYFKTLCLMGSTPNCTWIHMCQGNALSCTINTIHTHLQRRPQMCDMSTVCVALPRAHSWAEPSIAKHWLQRHKLLYGRTIFVSQGKWVQYNPCLWYDIAAFLFSFKLCLNGFMQQSIKYYSKVTRCHAAPTERCRSSVTQISVSVQICVFT